MIQKELLLEHLSKIDEHGVEKTASELGIKQDSLERYIRLGKELFYTEPKKVLVFDIETSPMINYNWGVWQQNVAPSQVIRTWNIISWSAKWLGEEEVFSDVLNKFEARTGDDTRITKSLWEKFHEADIVLAHNAKKFDVKRANTRFIYRGLPLPSPYKVIDTLPIVRKMFNFPHNKLDFICKELGLDVKISTTFQLWDDCMRGNDEALKKMEEYNIQDVKILELLYYKLRPYIPSHPIIYPSSNMAQCPICGKHGVTDYGTYSTSVNELPAFKCNHCSSILRKRSKNIDELVSSR